jgi:ABC-type Fe3+ transport system substrate-binding protein
MTTKGLIGRRFAAFTAAAAVAVFAAGGASALTVDEIANYNKPDREKVLAEIAKKEGELLWIGGLNEKTATRPMLEGFMKKFPYIKAKSIRTGTNEGIQRVLAEARAKTPRVDLLNIDGVLDLKNSKLAQKFTSPLLDSWPDEFKDPEHYYAALRYTYQGVAAWNTDQVKKEDAPRTWDDLLNPKWKGKMVWADSDDTGAQLLITYFRKIWGEEKTLDYMTKLSKQNLTTRTEAARNILDLVVAGEYPIMINPALHHIGGARKEGAPIDGSMQAPVLTRNGYLMMMNTAPHPASTMLLIDYLLDTEAQSILKDSQYYPANPKVDPSPEMLPYLPRAFGMKQFTPDDETLFTYGKRSQEIFRQLFQ